MVASMFYAAGPSWAPERWETVIYWQPHKETTTETVEELEDALDLEPGTMRKMAEERGLHK